MKKVNLAALCLSTLACLFVANAANATVTCTVLMPPDASRPAFYVKPLFVGEMKANPSQKEQDRRRSTWVIVKKDNSAAYEISRDELDKMDAENGYKAIDGDSLIAYQETPHPGVYAIYINAIDASLKREEMKQIAVSIATITKTTPLALALGIPNSNFGVLCEQKK